MKKIIIFITLLIFIPFFIVIIYNKNYKEIELKYISPTYIRVKRMNDESIIKLPLEEYIVGVLAGEMPISFELEALKAQAVASRSYALKRIEYNKEKEYDVVDSVINQVYLDDNYLKEAWKDNYIENINKLKTAVLETKGEYLEYNNEVVEAFFFSTSSGKTENSEEVFSTEYPYLRSVESPYDKYAPKYASTLKISNKDFVSKLKSTYSDINISQNNLSSQIKILSRSDGGSIEKIKLGNKEITGRDVRNILNLNSANFEINFDDNSLDFVVKGYGHGVGMSQWGAQGMAEEGYKYYEILCHYYKDATIDDLY